MTSELLLASLQLSMPEIILAVGALALLMIGVFSGDKSAPTVTGLAVALLIRSEEHTSELQSLMRISYAVFCLKKKKSNHKDTPASKHRITTKIKNNATNTKQTL